MPRKAGVTLAGIFLSALGVSLSMKSNLGATPIGVCPAVFSPALKISAGTGMGILLGIFFVAQMILLKKDFHATQLMQLAATVIYSVFVDFTTNIVSVLPDGGLGRQALYCGLGIVTLAFGVFTMLKTDFVMLPQDAVVNVISQKYHKEYGKIKIALDGTLTIAAVMGSWILYRGFFQVGIGTVAGALFVGKILNRLKELEGVNAWLSRAINKTEKEAKYGSAKNNFLVASENE